jgi:putative SOS response-associated peptidase YedK
MVGGFLRRATASANSGDQVASPAGVPAPIMLVQPNRPELLRQQLGLGHVAARRTNLGAAIGLADSLTVVEQDRRLAGDGGRTLSARRLGLTDPSDDQPIDFSDVERLEERAFLLNALHRRRCIIPITGYLTAGDHPAGAGPSSRQPRFVCTSGNRLLLVAGICGRLRPGARAVAALTLPDPAGTPGQRTPALIPEELVNQWIGTPHVAPSRIGNLLGLFRRSFFRTLPAHQRRTFCIVPEPAAEIEAPRRKPKRPSGARA